MLKRARSLFTVFRLSLSILIVRVRTSLVNYVRYKRGRFNDDR